MNRSQIRWTFVAAWVLASTSGALAQRANSGDIRPLAVGDTPTIIYFVPGVRDDGAAIDNTGVSTVIHCSNFSPVTERLSFVVRDFNSIVRSSKIFDLASLHTMSTSTHFTGMFSEDLELETGAVTQGLAVIRSTSTNVVCTAMMVDAASTKAEGIALHMVSFNPIPGTQE